MINSRSLTYFLFVLLLVLLFTAGAAIAQTQGNTSAQSPSGGTSQMGPPGGQGGQAGGPMMQRDPAQMQKMMAQRFKKLLGLSDAEWSVIGPKIMKVESLSRQSRGGRMRMFMGRRSGNRGATSSATGQGGTANQGRRFGSAMGNNRENASEVEKSIQALETLIKNKNATNTQIESQLTEVRKAREKSARELAQARKELREVLTIRQEATLVVMGILE